MTTTHGYVGPEEREKMLADMRRQLEEKNAKATEVAEELDELEREISRLEGGIESHFKAHAMLLGVEALDRWTQTPGPVPQHDVEVVRCAVLAKDTKRTDPMAKPAWAIVDLWCDEWRQQLPGDTRTLTVSAESIQTVREYLLPGGKLRTRPDTPPAPKEAPGE